MGVDTKKQWSSLVTTCLWGTELGDEAEGCQTAFGDAFIPTSVEWIRYQFGELELGSDGVKYEDYTIVYALNDEHSMEFDLRMQEVPEWIPKPPEGWNLQPGSFAKSL